MTRVGSPHLFAFVSPGSAHARPAEGAKASAEAQARQIQALHGQKRAGGCFPVSVLQVMLDDIGMGLRHLSAGGAHQHPKLSQNRWFKCSSSSSSSSSSSTSKDMAFARLSHGWLCQQSRCLCAMPPTSKAVCMLPRPSIQSKRSPPVLAVGGLHGRGLALRCARGATDSLESRERRADNMGRCTNMLLAYAAYWPGLHRTLLFLRCCVRSRSDRFFSLPVRARPSSR